MSISEYKESFFINPDGIRLYKQIFEPINSQIKSLIFICHGLFEHCQSSYYEPIIKPFREIGCFILTHDHYGHGHSDGERGIISDVDILVRDVILDIEDTVKELELAESIPIYIYGHSLGGLVTVHVALKNKPFLKGIMLEAPALKHDLNGFTYSVLKFVNMACHSCPLLTLRCEDLSGDKAHNDKVRDDPFQIHTGVSAKTLLSIANSINECVGLFGTINIPVIIGHGDADKLTIPSGSKMFIENISSTEKILMTFPNAKHQLRVEINNINVEFTGKIVSWLEERIRLDK